MKINKSLRWGIFFVVMAVFVVMGAMDAFGNLSIWTVLFAGFSVMWLIDGIVSISIGNILFPVAILAILFDETLGITELTPWPVLFAALFGTIGLNMIFGNLIKRKKKIGVNVNGKSYKWENGNLSEETSETDERFDCEIAFGSCVKYVNSRNLKIANIENSFGSASIYFDNAQLCNGQATVNLENSFGKTVLYIPKEWNVNVNISKAFGSVTESDHPVANSANTLIIVGETSFGTTEIIYV